MKRFLIIATVLLVIISCGYYLYFYQGIYLEVRQDAPPEVAFRTEGKQLQLRLEDGSWQELSIQGVDIYASIPGKHMTDFAPEKEDYLRWLTAIGDMGANTVRAAGILDADFYNALYDYNTHNSEPLFLSRCTRIGASSFCCSLVRCWAKSSQ